MSLWIASWRKQNKEIKGNKKELKRKNKKQAWRWNKEEEWGERSTPWKPIPSFTHLATTRTAPQKGDAGISNPPTKRVLNYSVFLMSCSISESTQLQFSSFFPSYFCLDSEHCLIKLSHWELLPAMAAQPSVWDAFARNSKREAGKEGVRERKEKWIAWREREYKVKEEGEKSKGKIKRRDEKGEEEEKGKKEGKGK